jgi:hypothetical protein
LNGELESSPVPASGPVRALAVRKGLLPAVPANATMAAAGGLIAGAAVLAAVRSAGRRLRRGRRGTRRPGEVRRVIASRSFLVDVHLIER